MVESKFVVLQMIPHTLFIEWDFGHCSLAVLLFMTLFTNRLLFMVLFTSRWRCSLAVMKHCSHIRYCSCIRHCSYIRYYSYDQFFFFFKCSFLDLFNLKFYA